MLQQNKDKHEAFTSILRDELQMALGCTEPIAIAYCAACTTRLLGKCADRFEVYCSGNIIKNVKAVTVPQTGGMVGIEAAVLIGAIAGDASLKMEVLSHVTDQNREELIQRMNQGIVKVNLLNTAHPLHIIIEAFSGQNSASVEIVDEHTQLGTVKKNGEVLHQLEKDAVKDNLKQRQALNLKDILEYANTVELAEVEDVLERQIKCNLEISQEGLSNMWGAAVGQTLMKNEKDLYAKLCAAASAGSDARMNGCAMPVVTNSGSGNQGMTISIPVALYAKEKKYSRETMLRGLCVANLTAVHQKAAIGKLSAFCGAVSAAAGAACGIAFMDGADLGVISQTLVNCIASVGGMVCDGAKSSCAAKIAIALNSAFIGYEMAKLDRGFRNGEGIVKEDVEATISSVGRMAAKGMRQTDTEILNIMIGK